MMSSKLTWNFSKPDLDWICSFFFILSATEAESSVILLQSTCFYGSFKWQRENFNPNVALMVGNLEKQQGPSNGGCCHLACLQCAHRHDTIHFQHLVGVDLHGEVTSSPASNAAHCKLLGWRSFPEVLKGRIRFKQNLGNLRSRLIFSIIPCSSPERKTWYLVNQVK